MKVFFMRRSRLSSVRSPSMYKRARNLGLPWPLLAETDVGDLITYLNTTPGD